MRAVFVFALFAVAVAVPVDHMFHPKSDADLKCTLCQDVVGIAEKKLQSNGTEEAIKDAIESVCSVIEKHIPVASELCEAVENNIDEIIQLLESEVTPEEVCKLIKLCDNTNPVVQTPHMLDLSSIAESVNSLDTTWKAESPSRFGDLVDVKKTLGTWMKGHPQYFENNLEVADKTPGYILKDIPDSFDARTNFTNCSIIAKVRDQSSCGSCWAFASTEAFEDSRCIATGEDREYSTADTAGCCKSFMCGFSQGCNGGQPSSALSWMTKSGVVTGGDFYDIGTNASGCLPYAFQPCAHHVPPSSKYPACPSSEYKAECKKECSSPDYSKSYDDDKTTGTKAFSLSSEEGMQTAIMTTGPLAVAFTVYSDFPTYKSGVYKHVSGSALGGHAVEMVGWGVEDGTKYWLIKNSWNEQWGDGGFFKIARGVDECGIEDDVTGIRFA